MWVVVVPMRANTDTTALTLSLRWSFARACQHVNCEPHLVVQLSEESQFILPHDPGEDEMAQRGKSFLQFEADSSQGDAVGENHISDHVPGREVVIKLHPHLVLPPHHPGSVVVSLDGEHSRAHDPDIIWPRQQVVLVPPSG